MPSDKTKRTLPPRTAWLTAIALALCVPSAASAETEQDFGIWGALFFTSQLQTDAPSAAFWLDAHGRRGDLGTVAILRPGAGLAFAPWGSLWAGYAWVPRWLDASSERSDEQRAWEQLIFETKRPAGIWLHSRTRFEQRFLKGSSGTAHRFRQLGRLNYMPKRSVPVGLASWDEVFVGIEGASWAKQGFDQNRAFVGLAVQALQSWFRVEVGYLNVFVSRQTKLMEHVLSMNFFVSYKPAANTSRSRE